MFYEYGMILVIKCHSFDMSLIKKDFSANVECRRTAHHFDFGFPAWI